ARCPARGIGVNSRRRQFNPSGRRWHHPGSSVAERGPLKTCDLGPIPSRGSSVPPGKNTPVRVGCMSSGSRETATRSSEQGGRRSVGARGQANAVDQATEIDLIAITENTHAGQSVAVDEGAVFG